MSLSVRPMQAGDLEQVLAIAGALAEAPQWARAAYGAAIEPGGGPHRIALVAEDEAGVAGFAVACLVESEAELESIAVAARAQRRGVATRLMATLIRSLKAAGGEVVVLEMRASNKAAAALYEGAGFLQVGRRPKYYSDPVEDALVLRMDL